MYGTLARNGNISIQQIQQTLSEEDLINFGNTRIYHMIVRLS